MDVEDRLELFLSKKPQLEDGVYLSNTATVIGDVRIGKTPVFGTVRFCVVISITYRLVSPPTYRTL